MRPTVVLSSLLLPLVGTHAFAQSVAELEPNGSVAQGQTLVAGQHVAANLVAGEQDWFAFTLAAPGQVQVRTSGNYAVNPSVDTYVAIYDAAGATRLAWDDNSDGTHSVCGVTLPAGSYSVLVVGKTGTVQGDYGLDYVVLPATLEPDDQAVWDREAPAFTLIEANEWWRLYERTSELEPVAP